MLIRKTTPQEQIQVAEIASIAFEFSMDRTTPPVVSPKKTTWAAFTKEAGDMTGIVSVHQLDMQFDGQFCKAGGIGGVASLPQYRHQGGIRGCLEAALADMYADGFDFSYLFPFSTVYYRKFGYECCVHQYAWCVNLALLNPPKASGYSCLAQQGNSLVEYIHQVDLVWEHQYNMMVKHSPEDYSWTESFDPAVTQEFTYVCFDEKHVPNAYTTFHVVTENDQRNLQCSRFCFTSRSGFMNLMRLFKNLSVKHTFLKFRTPAVPALRYLMPEWEQGAVEWSFVPWSGMIRAVNVEQVLSKARYIGNGQLTLRIFDQQIPENNGIFHICFADGKATSVTKNDRSPDISINISAFSALISGVCSFRDSAWMGGIEIHNPSACYDQVFYQKIQMITHMF